MLFLKMHQLFTCCKLTKSALLFRAHDVPILCVCTCLSRITQNVFHALRKTINYTVLRLPWDSDDGGTGINCFMDVWNDVSQ